MIQEFWVNVNLILKETEEMLLKEGMMFICNLTVFACPTDDPGWSPRRDLVCSKSLIRDGEGRMIRALRRLQCFIRLGMMSIDLAEFTMHGLWKEPDAGCSVKIKMYTK